MSNDYGNWCPEIYRSMFIDRHNSDQLRVAPCCQADSRLEKVTDFDFNTSEYLNQLREKFNRGERPKECIKCWQAEELGTRSRREGAIEFFQSPEIDRSVSLQRIDYNTTWACNLACVMCGPQSSSLWATQKNLNKSQLSKIGRHFRNQNNFLDKLEVAHVKRIHFNGGEPLLNNDHIDMLVKLEQQDVLKNTEISYNTNGTMMPNKKTIDLWNKSRLVRLYFSIDAVGTAFEYIRWPGVWSQTCKNMLDMKRDLPSNVMFGFNSTIGSHNLFEMIDVWNWFDQNISTNREGDMSDFCWQFANNFDIKYLPMHIKSQAIEQLRSTAVLDGVVKHIELTFDHDSSSDWMLYLSQLDSVRNTDWITSLKIGKYIKELPC